MESLASVLHLSLHLCTIETMQSAIGKFGIVPVTALSALFRIFEDSHRELPRSGTSERRSHFARHSVGEKEGKVREIADYSRFVVVQ